MAVSAKGKGVDHDSDSSSDIDFFIRKPPTVKRHVPPPPREPSPEYQVISGDSDDPDAEKKRRRKPRKRVGKSAGWASATVVGQKKREKERNQEAIVILSDSDEDTRQRPSQTRITLTPPPTLSEETKAQVAKAIGDAFAGYGHFDTEPTPDLASSSSSAPSSSSRRAEEQVTITVRMVAPPERANSGSAKAVQRYEKRREYEVSRRGPLSNVIDLLAADMRKSSDELVLVWKGSRILSLRLSSQDLGIEYETEMSGYEKHFWLQIEEDRKAARQRLLAGEDDDSTTPSRNGNGHGQQDTPVLAPAAPDRVVVQLVGEAGTHKGRVEVTYTARSLCRWYCQRVGKDKSEAENMYLRWEGERVDASTTVADLDLEDGDQIDVVYEA